MGPAVPIFVTPVTLCGGALGNGDVILSTYAWSWPCIAAASEASMFRDWDAYDCHPVIGPLIEEYRQHIREMEYVKNGLRTEDNIQEVMQMSAEAAEIKREIHGLMQIEEQARASRQRDTVWLFTTAAAIAVGILNIGIALF